MINLDNLDKIRQIDQSNMLNDLKSLPEQLKEAWKIANNSDLPKNRSPQSIILAGMGGSAIGADILASYVFNLCQIPIYVIRGYRLPKWVNGKDSLVICSSHSGNTEETISVFEQSLQRKCEVVAISRGGQLQILSKKNNTPFWQFTHNGQPRSAVGFSFGLLLSLFVLMKFIPDQNKQLENTAEMMKDLISEIDINRPVVHNQAKRIAGQAMNRHMVILGAEHLEPIARRWKTQINELAKCWAQFEFLPEADHNTLAGLDYPQEILLKTYAIFLESANYHPQNSKRMNLTFDQFMIAGLCTDRIMFTEKSTLSEIWKLIVLGDFVTFYLSMLYEVDPTPIAALEEFKTSMKE